MPALSKWDTIAVMHRSSLALVAAALIVLPAPWARADGQADARRAMREAAIEKADLAPRPVLEPGPGEPRRPSMPSSVPPSAPAPGPGREGGAPSGLPPSSPPGQLREAGSARAEAHRLAIEAVGFEAGLRDALPPGLSATLPAPRAAESNASANGLAHSAATAAHAGAVRKATVTPPGLGAGTGNGNGNGNGNGKGNGKP